MEVALKLLLLRALLPFALELFKCQLNCFNSARAVILITQNTLQTTEGSISTGRVKARTVLCVNHSIGSKVVFIFILGVSFYC